MSSASPLSLWYTQPATEWVEALAVGNGRLGAMVFGGVEHERLALNEDTLWAGGPYDPVNPKAKAALPKARQLIAAGQIAEATALTDSDIMAVPLRQLQYQTAGDLLLDFPDLDDASDYRRSLDLDTAVVTTVFTAGGVTYTREVLASPVDQVIVLHLTADRPGSIHFSATMQTPQDATVSASTDTDAATLLMAGRNGESEGIPGALTFQARLQATADGAAASIRAAGDRLEISGADSATLYLAIATSYLHYDDVSGDPEFLTLDTLAAATPKPWAELRAASMREHQRLFRRVALDLGSTPAAALPTDQRLRAMAAGDDDPALVALYFQFGRYLLISCSRPGTQTANLQGIWNDSMNPPWGSKYTININIQMNYWPVDSTDLGECIAPLTALVEELSMTGAHTAREMYGARGWVTHHNTDLWRAAAPIDAASWGMWPCGGAWLAIQLYDHYRFILDRAYLERIYPLLRGAALFFLDTLVEDPSGRYLVTSPSGSPENAHHPKLYLSAGPTMDCQIVRDLFSAAITAADTLGLDKPFVANCASARDRLPPNQIGAQGQLQEWLEDWDASAPEQQHRHVSHLYGFYPSSQINLRGTPDLAAAVAKTLDTRGDISTGWAIAWRINLWARQQDGERTYRIIKALLDPSRTYPNLFDAHPPFQIDGNFGGTAGIAELLLQSHIGDVELLPALPAAWPTGSVRGLRARGGYSVDLAWRDGALTTATLRGPVGSTVTLRHGGTVLQQQLPASGKLTVDAALQRLD